MWININNRMEISTLFIHPDALIGRVITYHPILDLLVAGGISDGDGAVLYLKSKIDLLS